MERRCAELRGGMRWLCRGEEGSEGKGGKGRGVDACMEVDGRLGERRGNIYISKRT